MIPYNKNIAITEIKNQMALIDSINPDEMFSKQFKNWKIKTETLLSDIFSNDSRQVKDFLKLKYRPSISFLTNDVNDRSHIEYFKNGLNNAKVFLESLIKEIEKYWPDTNKSSEYNSDIIDIKPNFMGIGLNINAIYKKLFKKK